VSKVTDSVPRRQRLNYRRTDTSAAATSERRHRPRREQIRSVRATPIGAAFDLPPQAFTSQDISEAGLQLLGSERFAVGVRLLITIEAGGTLEPISVVGRVIWSEFDTKNHRSRLGVQLEELHEAARSQLRKLLRRQR
jgi:hypothetical protein